MIETLLVLLLVFTVVFNSYPYATLLAHVMIILLLLMFFMLVRKSVVTNSLQFLLYGIIWCLTFVAGTFMSNNSPYVGDMIDILYISILIMFTCLFMGIKFEKSRIKTIFWIYIICNLLVSVNIIINYLIGNYYVDQRASFFIHGVYKDPNYVSSLIVPAVFFAFLILKKMNHFFQKLLLAVALGIMVLAILITGSRAALIGLLMPVLVYITLQILSRNTKFIYKIGIILGAIITAFVGSYILMTSGESRLTDVSGYMNDIRVVIWSDALSFWARSPIIGNGVNAVSNYTLTCWYGRATHNCFLDLLGDSGLVGIICLIGIIRLIIKKLQDKGIAIAFAVACLVPQAFINGFYGFNFWFLICLFKLLVNYQETERQKTYTINQ